MKAVASLLLAAISVSAAVPLGQNVRVGATTINVTPVGVQVPGVPYPPNAKGGIMILVSTENEETAAYTISVKAVMQDGSVVSDTQTVRRIRSWNPFSGAVFLIGRIAELKSVSVDELKSLASTEF